MLMNVFEGILIPFVGTTLGAACVFFMRKTLSKLLQRALAGFAAGIMVAASIWSLLIPAIKQSENMGTLSFVPAVVGFWIGILFLLALDHLIPHLHVGSDQAEGPKSKLGRTTMMVLAVTLHNIPEGMAVGVMYAGFLAENAQITATSALALSLGIAIQNFPEGAELEDLKKYQLKSLQKQQKDMKVDHAGIYEMCKKDYPDILEELEKEPFRDLLDAGCGPAPMISLLAEKYPDRHYTGLDLTPAMIEQAKKKDIPNATFVVGDCENFPFENDSFDAIICSMSFHHYPDPQAFFDSVKRCLRPNGRLILRDVTSDNKVLVWLMNTLEMPLANICGHGDVQVPTRDVVIKCCKKAGLKVEKFEIRKGMRMHCVVRKPMGKAIGNER